MAEDIDLRPNIPSIVNTSPQVAAALSKLNTGQSANQRPYTAYNHESIVRSTANKIRNNESILKLLPDLKIAIQIMTSSIIDPNSMVSNGLVYKAPAINLATSVKSAIITTIKKYIDTNYKIEDKLPKILEEALFTKGCYIEAIIPEASVDRLINYSGGYNGITSMAYYRDGEEAFISQEALVNAFSKTKVPTHTLSTESIVSGYSNMDISKIEKEKRNKTYTFTESNLNFEFTTDYSILRRAKKTIDNLTGNAKKDRFTVNLEAEAGTDTISYLNSLFRNTSSNRPSEVEFGLKEDETIRDSVATPLVMQLPPESVIPIYATGEPDKHVGYFVMLDQFGNPVDLVTTLQDYDLSMACGNNTPMPNSTDIKTSIINKAKLGLFGGLSEVPEIENIEQLYGDIVDHMIKSRLRSGDLEDLVEIRNSADIYRVMLARALQSKSTKLLYLPIELVQYYAFDYRRNGTGKSLLEDLIVLASMAGMLLYANVKSSIQNTIPITDITLELDEDDTNPMGTAEKYMSEVMRTNNVAFPLGTTEHNSLHNWVIKQGYTLKVISPYLPKMDVTRDVRTGVNGDAIDSSGETYSKIMNMILKSLGISPELIEQGLKEDFAATVVIKNKLLAKRIIALQDKTMVMLSKHIRKYITNDPILRQEIADTVRANKETISKHVKASIATDEEITLDKIKPKDLENFIIDIFRTTIEVELPYPEFGDDDEKSKAFEGFKSKLDSVVDSLYSPELLDTYFVGAANQDADKIKAMIKAGATRQWLQNNNYLTETYEWYVKQDDGHLTYPFFDENADMAQSVVEAFINYAERRGKDVTKLSETYNKKVIKKFGELSDGSGYGGYSSDDSYGSDSSDSDSSGDSDMGDDFNMDLGGDSEETMEETTVEETSSEDSTSESTSEAETEATPEP
jgi:virion structural protein|nr:MAG TPA: capsid assembly protein [Caudoviricetes sp.]